MHTWKLESIWLTLEKNTNLRHLHEVSGRDEATEVNITLSKCWFAYVTKDISSNKLKYKGNGINWLCVTKLFPTNLSMPIGEKDYWLE